jgi:anhydro-N-acetylmuramic acid kinase
MSGTSLDGVDGVVVRWNPNNSKLNAAHQVLAHAYLPFPELLRHEMLALNTSGSHELHRTALAANQLAHVYAGVVRDLLRQSQLSASAIRAIGAHGQTVRHCPPTPTAPGYTLQLNQPALLAELCGVDVIADFRSRDVAAGGQGAPLVCAFHQAICGALVPPSNELSIKPFDKPAQAVLNLGGISNLTLLPTNGDVLGFDCGPANVLMDLWAQHHLSAAYDRDGVWAASGQVLPTLLHSLLTEPYFQASPPKSTGRDLFHWNWLQQHLHTLNPSVAAQDVQATLAELTAVTCAQALDRHAPQTRQLWVCGGGALNTHLMHRLRALCPGIGIQPTDDLGWPVMQIEAAAFAWLAWRHIQRLPGNLPSVTGAQGPRVLGACYPA